nr:hypothetical protein [Nitrosomonas sp.]
MLAVNEKLSQLSLLGLRKDFMVMKKYSLWLLAGLVSGSIMTATTAAEIKSIGPKPIISTDITKGTLFVKPNGTGTTCSLALPC